MNLEEKINQLQASWLEDQCHENSFGDENFGLLLNALKVVLESPHEEWCAAWEKEYNHDNVFPVMVESQCDCFKAEILAKLNK